jgi:hypothetical protein
MDTEKLIKELSDIDSLIEKKILTEARGEQLKESIIKTFEKDSTPQSKELPNDLAHLPGRMVGGVFKALGNINGARCAGVAPEQVEARKHSKSPKDMEKGLPDIYK